MHELSMVMNIVEISGRQLIKQHAETIEEIELEIGELSGVEMEAFDFAWNCGVQGTILEKAKRVVNKVNARAKCVNCNEEFSIHQLYDTCPSCGSFIKNIVSGNELKVKKMVIR